MIGGNTGPSQPPKKSVTIRAEISGDAQILADEEHAEFHPGVLGMIAGHQLALRLRQIKGEPARLGNPRDQEDHEAQGIEGCRTIDASVPPRS